MFQYVDLEHLKYDFVQENRQEIPPEFANYADLWENWRRILLTCFWAILIAGDWKSGLNIQSPNKR